jgi:hypothetical protein
MSNDQIIQIIILVVSCSFALYTVERLRTGYLPGELFFEGIKEWLHEQRIKIKNR